jgi:hypothetical protein
MPEAAFVPLADVLRAPRRRAEAQAAGDAAAPAATVDAPPVAAAADGDADPADGVVERLEAFARFQLAALEALDRGVERILTALAEDVLGRELRLAPAAVARLCTRAVAEFAASGPLAAVCCAADAAALEGRLGLPVRVDPAFGPGDFALEVRDGTLASPVRFRLSRALTAVLDG